MTKQMQRLLQRRAEKLDANTALLAAAEAESRELTAEERATVQANLDAADALQSDIDMLQRQETAAATLGETVTPRVVVGPANAEADPLGGFQSRGEFLQAVLAAGTPGNMRDSRLVPFAAATGMNQGIGSQGGFLVPASLSTAIWDGMRQNAENLVARCDPYTVEGESLTMNAEAETSRATGSRWGGVRGYWLSEAAQITGSKPTFRQVKLEPKELAVLVYCTDKLLRNSAVALEQYIQRVATDEIMFLVNDAIVNGDGAGKPLGILGAGCTVSQAKEAGQAAATVVAENIAKMWARRLGRSFVWLINREVTEQLDYLQLNAGVSGQLVYMPPGGLSGNPFATLKGAPVIETEFNAALGTVGDIILADLKAYAVGLKGGVRADASMHIRFDYAETAFRIMFEIDGRPWLASPLTPYKATSGKTLSPFVTLATRA